MSGNAPLATILINNYNYGRFLREAIDSALSQTYSNTEVIVVDDGSTDQSREVIAGYGDHVIAVFKDNGGQASAFNAGFAASSGQWIFFLDSDDLFLPGKIGRILELAEQNPQAGLIAHDLEYCDVRGVKIDSFPVEIPVYKQVDERKRSRRGKQRANMPATSGLCIRRDVLNQILPMAQQIRLAADNYLKVIALSLTPALLTPEQLARQRIHGSNLYTFNADILADEAGRLLHARISAQIAFELRRVHPHLKILAWKHYGRGLGLLASSNSGKTRSLRAEIRSRYNVMEMVPACLFYVAGAFAKTFVKNSRLGRALRRVQEGCRPAERECPMEPGAPRRLEEDAR